MSGEIKDFRAYELLDNGEKQELTMEIESLKDNLHVEQVLLLVRFDLRRLFIWKGPKSPVRKRFISSREGSKIQEDAAKSGAHLKIVSVDAGDEPPEFLTAFNLQTFEVKEEDKLGDMYYVRNEERRKAEEAAQAEAAKKKAEPKEYWSPLLEEQKKAAKAEANSGTSASPTAPAPKIQSAPTPAASPAPAPRKVEPRYEPAPAARAPTLNDTEEKAMVNKIAKEPLAADQKRLNIIVGTHLFGPQEVVTKVFGKEVKTEEWGRILEIPAGNIDLDAGNLRIHVENNEIKAIEVLANTNAAEKAAAPKPEVKALPLPVKTAEIPKESPAPATEKGKRELHPIPKGE